MNVGRLVEEYLDRHNRSAYPPSPLGRQIQNLRNGIVPSGGNPSAQEEVRIYYATLIYAFKALTGDEHRVLFSIHTPVGVEPYTRQCRNAHLRTKEIQNPDGTKEWSQETPSGERFVCSVRKEDGELDPDWVTVEGLRWVFPTRETVAEQLGLTFNQVRYLISCAYAKILSSMQYQAIQEHNE